MRGFVTIWQINTFTSESNEMLSKVFFSIQYDDGQYISTEIILSAFKSNQRDIFEAICKYFKGELQYRY